jgi:hypothetical protein
MPSGQPVGQLRAAAATDIRLVTPQFVILTFIVWVGQSYVANLHSIVTKVQIVQSKPQSLEM